MAGRIIDLLHLAARCHKCGGLNKIRLFTLMSSQPLCAICLVSEWQEDARRAGLEFICRDAGHRHYAHYRAPCGHTLRRQFALIKRAAVGETGVRCEVCHAQTEAEEARRRGWVLVGPDPKGDPVYRLYSHDACGHQQRVARSNVVSGRFSCGKCSEEWPAAPSFLYAMLFTLENGRELVKLGFSRDPESRLHFQLKRNAEMPCELLRTVPMETGKMTLQVEKALHKRLQLQHPDAVLDPSTWHRQIRVKSEIYDATMRPVIMAMLDEVDTSTRGAAA